MTTGIISLDEWLTQNAASLRGRDRQIYIFFQKDWIQGHQTNPLLFPVEMSADAWRENFEWFQHVEHFSPPEVPTAPSTGEAQDHAPEHVQAPAQSLVDLSATRHRSETVVMAKPDSTFLTDLPPAVPASESQSDLDLDGLEDLSTLVTEAGHQTAPPPPISGSAPAKAAPTTKLRPPARPAPKTEAPKTAAPPPGKAKPASPPAQPVPSAVPIPDTPADRPAEADLDLDLGDLEGTDWEKK